ncbi:MAG: alpha-glucosidase [Flavobacteriaceae bacterium]|jgi:oligo-1,6-glucosidase|nr:alpha-glucosidase [Flavobacteriaceae bacterium]MBT4960559.1 alpha-glucosidase [Flavobacteriaceae bacterium]MBT6654674.1 alpha-glucosidase [Flavobacteriaceae bacterium]MBT7573911.1 alpha-glucosidase [Flavobacteriaceae bacterium]MDG1967368.1 alpha-glucosidase [Flavobacteriaceae bacterium]|tara:strand:- start:4052 stop:5719 length:1668 start_codon:yes stop_codon:yes gene_type:complete
MIRKWWKEQVVYQIYPRSFYDSNNDGIGDIKGIILKLDYLKLLGIDIIWISPHFDSPNDDNGYDIRNYKKVMEEFGTMEDFDLLLNEIHIRKMKLIIDLVVNHSSDEHNWFIESKSSKDNKYRDYYIWKAGDKNSPPNNWTSFFGGSAWEKDPISNDYYLHYFSKKQPDLNWENNKVREEVYDVMKFWLDKGIDGFRMDVIPFISKDQDFNNLSKKELLNPEKVYASGPRLHEFLKEMNSKVLSKYDILSIGEAFGISEDTMIQLSDEREEELDLVFLFDIIRIGRENWIQNKWNLAQLKKLFNTQSSVDEFHWPTVFLNNHDNPRSVSKYGNDKDYRIKSAKLLAMLTLTQRGTPILYQGEEIGMTNYNFSELTQFDDLEVLGNLSKAISSGISKKEYILHLNKTSRDHSRTTMQWSSGTKGGFSNGNNNWFLSNPNHDRINVENDLNNEDSIFHFYRKLLQIRKQSKDLIYGHYFDLDPNHQNIFIYQRVGLKTTYLIILNMSDSLINYNFNNLTEYSLEFSNLNTKPRISSNQIELLAWDALMFKKIKYYDK